jgi:hypothetical protein
MARARKAASKSAAKPSKAASKGPSARGQKIAEAQKKNAEVRAFISGLSSVQLTNFRKKLEPKVLKRVRRASTNAESKSSDLEKKKIAKQIASLTKKMKNLG